MTTDPTDDRVEPDRTDEAQAIEWQGSRALLVSGESTNLKVTTATDLAIAEGVLRARAVERNTTGALRA